MKKLLMILLLTLLTININCGGGGGSGSSAKTSLVTITVGNSSSGQAMGLLYKQSTPYVGLAAVPSNVYKIDFTIAAPGMPTITKEVFVAGQAAITESFSIPNGNNRYFLVEAKNASGDVLYRGDITANLSGEPVTLIIYMSALDTTPPTVISTGPANSATGVPITSAIIITFSETIDSATFNSSTFTLRNNGNNVAGTITVNGALVIFTPSSNLAYSTTYTGTITTGVRDLVGNAMAADYIWSFTTGAAPDTTPPTVIAVSPGIGATDVPVTSTLTATFSEAMNASTINTSTFTLMDGDSNPVSGTVTYAGTTATFTPSSNLATGITYTATITTGVGDLAGNAMAENYTWSFTTIVPDVALPTFGGLVSATATSASQIQLQWNPATDDVTPASNITYLIYMATSSGGQNFASPSYSVIGAASANISGLTPCTTYYFIVRARDLALNTDTNTVERSAKTQCIAWAKTYGGADEDFAYSIQQTTDGGYIVAGYTYSSGTGYDFWVLKLNSTGGIVWQRTYGGTYDDFAYSIQQTSDGGYIVAGYTGSFGAGSNDLWVLKLNSTGGIVWQRTYGGTGTDWAWSIRQTSDGGYVVAGYTDSFGAGSGDLWVLKLNSTGGIVWQNTYGGTTGLDIAYSIQQTTDGGYIVAGGTGSFGAGSGDLWVLKLNSTGGIVWQNAYGDTGDDPAFSIQQTSDGGYIVAGYTGSFGAGSNDLWVLKLNSTGGIVWQRTYGGTGNDGARSIQQTTDGGYIVAGYTGSFGAGSNDLWVLKLDSAGGIVWQRTYGGTDDDAARSIQQTSDGGYIVAGETYSFGLGGICGEGYCSDFWVLKLNSDGTLGCGFGVGTTSTAPSTGVSGVATSATVTTPTPTVTTTAITGQNTSATVGTQCSGGSFVDLQLPSASIVGMNVNYTIINNGSANANNVTVWVEYGDISSSACSPRTIPIVINPGGDYHDTVSTSPITPTIYTIVVDPNNTIPESNETNNCLDSGSGGCSFPPSSCP